MEQYTDTTNMTILTTSTETTTTSIATAKQQSQVPLLLPGNHFHSDDPAINLINAVSTITALATTLNPPRAACDPLP